MAALAGGAAVIARAFGSVLLRRAAQLGERRADRAAQRLAERIGTAFPGVSVDVTRGRVRLKGRRLRRRWITDAALRWLGRLLR